MKILKVKNEYGDTPVVFYRWSKEYSKFFMQYILDEVEENLREGYPINLEIVEMTEKKFNKTPILN